MIANHPLSAINAATKGYEPNQTNFPCLSHFFNGAESIGSTTLTDVAGGVVLTPSIPIAESGQNAGFIKLTTETLVPTIGTFTDPDDIDTLVVGLFDAQNDLAQMSLGDAVVWSTAALTLAGASVNVVSGGGGYDGTNVMTGDGLVSTGLGTIMGHAVSVNFSGPAVIEYSHADVSLIASALTADSPVTSGTPADVTTLAFTENQLVVSGILTFCGWAMLKFSNGIPDDIQTGLNWMFRQWYAEHAARAADSGHVIQSTIYPGWKGVV